jgi:hypothetical protein
VGSNPAISVAPDSSCNPIDRHAGLVVTRGVPSPVGSSTCSSGHHRSVRWLSDEGSQPLPQPSAPDFEQRLAAFASTAFRVLRPGQQVVLSKYASDHLHTPDLAIEMPTGEGKTLLALLIADWALDQGRSVAYLTGTRQLAERVEEEAAKLGLDVVRFASKDYGGAKLDDYHQAHAVGVMNYWVYFNSKPVPRAADLVIFDDAHLAEQPLSALQTLRIPDKAGPALDLYRTICNLVVAHTDAYPGLRAMHDARRFPVHHRNCCRSAIGLRSPRPSGTRSSGRPMWKTKTSDGFGHAFVITSVAVEC